MMSRKVLLIDDDGTLLYTLKQGIGRFLPSVTCELATGAEEARKLFAANDYSVVVMDLSIDDTVGPESGFLLLKELRDLRPGTRFIMLTGQEKSEFAIRAQSEGISSYLSKPADIHQLSVLVQDGLDFKEIYDERNALKKSASELELTSLLIGESAATEKLREDILFAGSASMPVMLLGETGTGKTLCARAIHRVSKRSASPFIKWQAGSITNDEMIKSELFGHKKGAFTGAEDDKKGLLTEADGGTFFIDEVDASPESVQTLLLSTLQDKQFRRLGDNKELKSEFRLITATNADPVALTSDGKMRSDFYHRVGKCLITIPPLRERLGDIPLLTEKALSDLERQEEITINSVDDDIYDVLRSHSWPGNVRELIAVVENAAYRANFSSRSKILVEDVSLAGKNGSQQQTGEESHAFWDKVKRYKLSLIEDALSRHGGNKTKAAEELGLKPYSMKRMLED